MNFLTVANQVLIIYLLIFLGCGLYKIRLIGPGGVSDMTNLLCYVISPCLILNSFQISYSRSLLSEIIIAALSAFGVHFAAMAVGYAVFNKKTVRDARRRAVLRFSTIYSNCGFMGLPLLQALAGSKGLLFGAMYVGIYNLLNWTQGIAIYTGKVDKKSALKGILNPNVVAIALSVPLFCFSIKLPGFIGSGVTYVAAMNTALSMIVVGTQIADISPKTILTSKSAWAGVLFRNSVIPLMLLFSLYALGVRGELLLYCVVPAACPVGSFAVIFAGLTGKDTKFPAQLVMLSTILSIFTIPTVIMLEKILATH